jgi:hypothetical protein
MAETRVVTLLVETDRAQQNVEALNNDLATTSDRLEDVSEESKKVEDNFDGVTDAADKLTGGAISGFKGMITSIKGAVTGLKTMKGALIATGIGAFVVVLGSLAAAFTSSEEGQNKFNRIMRQIGVVVGNVKDAVAEFGEGLFALGGALKKVLSGDIKGALDQAGSAFDGFTEKVKNFKQETLAELGVADQISNKLEAANKLQRELIVDRAQADQDRARLLEQAINKEEYSIEQRIGFLQKASKIEEDITNREVQLAQLRLDAKILENSLSKSTTEDLEEEARLKSEVTVLETNRLNKQREVTSQILGLYNEEMAARKERDAEANAFALEIQKNADERKKLQKENKLKEEEEEKIRANKNMNDELARLQYEANQKVAIAQFVADAEAQIRAANIDNALSGFALLGNLAGENKALQAAALIGESAAGVAKTIINTQTSNAATIAQGAALAIPTGGASVAAASALVASNNISAGIAIASNIAATAKGLSALKAGGSPKGGAVNGVRGGGSPGAALPNSQAPQFNIVGTSGTNQLAETIQGKSNEPLKAYVVSSDVTSAQSLERNIVSGASI